MHQFQPFDNRKSFHLAALQPLLLALAAGALLTLSGCGMQGLNPQSTLHSANDLTLAHADNLSFSQAHWPSDRWWKQFGDAQLDQLIDEAIKTSPSLKLAQAKVRQAQSIENLQGAQLLPRVDANLSSTRERFSANATTPPPVAGTWQWLNQGGLNLSYELDFWGKNRASLQAAIGRTHASEVDSYAARLMLTSAIVASHISLQEITQDLTLENNLLLNRMQILDMTQRRFESDLDSQIDIKQVQASVPVSRARIAELQERKELTKNKLAALVGQGSARGQLITDPELSVPAGYGLPSELPADLIGRRPDIVAQRWRVEASGFDIEEAKARFYPNISLTGFAGLQSLGFDAFTHGSSRILGVAPALSLPVFDGARLRSNLSAQDAAYDIAVEAYHQSILNALHDVSDQVTSLKWLDERIRQQQDSAETATQAATLVQQRYQAGLANYIQVLYAQNQQLTQQLALSQLNARGLLLHAELSRALGGGYIPFKQP